MPDHSRPSKKAPMTLGWPKNVIEKMTEVLLSLLYIAVTPVNSSQAQHCVCGQIKYFQLTNYPPRNRPWGNVDSLLHERSKCEPKAVDDAEVVGDRGARYGLFNLPFIRRKSDEKITQFIFVIGFGSNITWCERVKERTWFCCWCN